MQPIQKILTAGSILLAGTALTTVPAAAQPGAGGPSALGNVYSTNDWGDLSVTEWEAESFRAGYTFERGKIEGVRKGNEIDGFWTQPRTPDEDLFKRFKAHVINRTQVNGNYHEPKARKHTAKALARRFAAAR